MITTDSGIILSPATGVLAMHSCTYTISTCIQFSVIVTFLPSDGTDYSSKSANVTFENGAYTTSVVVPIIDDSTIEPQEFFYGTLEAVQGINVLIDQAEIHIIDNDGEMKRQSLHTCCHIAIIRCIYTDQEVYLHQEKYIVSEVAGKLEVCVNRKEAIPTPLTIELSTMELAPLEAKGVFIHVPFSVTLHQTIKVLYIFQLVKTTILTD